MKTLTLIIGILITIPCIIVEAGIKLIIMILCIPAAIIAAVFYPLIKAKDWETYNQIKYLWEYATKIKRGFYCGRILSLWDYKTDDKELDW